MKSLPRVAATLFASLTFASVAVHAQQPASGSASGAAASSTATDPAPTGHSTQDATKSPRAKSTKAAGKPADAVAPTSKSK